MPWLTIDPHSAGSAIGPRTTAVVVVHLYGQPADLTRLQQLCDQHGLARLQQLCDQHGLALIEDWAQAHGAAWSRKPAGSFGSVACFSFYPTKNLGTVGDGGMVVTNDENLARRIAMLRKYGWSDTRSSLMPRWNQPPGPVAGGDPRGEAASLPQMVHARGQIAERYDSNLADLQLLLSREREGSHHAFHLYVMRCKDSSQRDKLLQHLSARGVAAGIHYPVPVHLQPAYRDRVATRALLNTEAVTQQVISLRIYPELTAPQQEAVVAGVREFHEAPG